MKEQHFYVGYEANEFIVFTAIPLIANVFFENYRMLMVVLLLFQLAVTNYYKLQWKKDACEKTHLNFISVTLLCSVIGLFLSWIRLALYLTLSPIAIVLSILSLPIPVWGAIKMAQRFFEGKNSKKEVILPTAIGSFISFASSTGFFVAKYIHTTTGDASILIFILAVGCYLISIIFIFAGLCPIAKNIIGNKISH